ncbi:MAG: DUF1573 domain-containing protein [Paludibacteraceae bacterium]|nr:DUF1573 domain-containing protein [Paludibacteraceae bacterium]
MKRSIFLSMLSLVAAITFAQKPVIEFVETSHDFGTIPEEGGRVTHTFEFTNTGATPLLISNVRASCGCTTPNWTKEPVEPGQKGIVTATYNPAGRPGSFNKTITVSSNATAETVRLSIHGTVTPKPAKTADRYPVKAGAVGLHNRAVGLGNINFGDIRAGQLKLANISDKPITVGVHFDEKYITSDDEPKQLDKEGAEAVIKLNFNTEEAKTWGPFTAYGQLVINGKVMEGDEYRIVLSGNVVEDFSKMSEQDKRNAPICELKGNTVNLGTLKKGGLKAAKLQISNQGAKSPLLIRRIIKHSDEMTVTAKKTSLAPGKKTDLVFSIDTDKLAPQAYKRSVNLITNDPNHSNVIIAVTWTIEE